MTNPANPRSELVLHCLLGPFFPDHWLFLIYAFHQKSFIWNEISANPDQTAPEKRAV